MDQWTATAISRSLQRKLKGVGGGKQFTQSKASTNVHTKSEEFSADKSANQVLRELRGLKLKIPGKSAEEAERALSEIRENWAAHKVDVEQYWLFTLDAAKRNKVIDIVRVNVRAVLRRLFNCLQTIPAPGPAARSPDDSTLGRLFSRVFSRMLWHGGQGLIDCFNNNSVDSWRVILDDSAVQGTSPGQPLAAATSAANIFQGSTEVDCCAAVVDLCRECLLIVYIAATEQQQQQQQKQQTLEQHQQQS